MAASATVDRTPVNLDFNRLVKVAISWVSDASGGCTQDVVLNGWLVKCVTNPGATAPTDDYDITLVDADGVDAAKGLLGNRDTANSEEVYLFASSATTPVLVQGTYTFTIANAGDSKVGVATFYLAECL